MPVWSRSVPDLPAARRGTRICAGNWQAGPPGSLRASHRHPGHLHGLSTSLCIPPYTADLAMAGVIGACSHASPGSHEVSRTGLPRLDRVAPSHQGSREPLRTATNLAAGPARPPTSRLETFSDAGARTEQYPLQTSAHARLAVKVERKPGAWSLSRGDVVRPHPPRKASFFPPRYGTSGYDGSNWPHGDGADSSHRRNTGH